MQFILVFKNKYLFYTDLDLTVKFSELYFIWTIKKHILLTKIGINIFYEFYNLKIKVYCLYTYNFSVKSRIYELVNKK